MRYWTSFRRAQPALRRMNTGLSIWRNTRNSLRNRRQTGDAQRQGVSLMTMHSAKGLEFRVVYILDANEGVTPHHKAVLDPDVEEERRMFYVAMTRAKERLHIYHVKERYRKKQAISRFAEEAEG